MKGICIEGGKESGCIGGNEKTRGKRRLTRGEVNGFGRNGKRESEKRVRGKC